MDVEFAEVIAETLDRIMSEPGLGNATTRQLLDELKARAEVGGYLNYTTVSDVVARMSCVKQANEPNPRGT
jgi:hypothetical protein